MADNQYRDSIVNELNKNMFVIAGAGSGKTTMLVNRMVSLIEKGQTTIDKICAITFTINAAAEFLKRLRETLTRRASGEVANEDSYPGGLGVIDKNTKEGQEIMERDAKALVDINLCFAGTIDAFCNLALAEYPLDADIPSSSSVLQDEEEIKALYKQEYARLSKKYNNDPCFKLFISMFRNPAKVFADAIGEVIEASFLDIQYPSTIPLNQFVSDFKRKYESDVKADFREIATAKGDLVLKTLSGEVCPAVDLYDKFEKRYKRFLVNWGAEEIFELPTLSSIFNGKLRFNSDPCNNRCLSFVPKKASKSYAPSFAYEQDCSFDLALEEVEEKRWFYAMDFLIKAANEVKSSLKKQGKLTFAEYLYTFKELIKNDVNNNNMVLVNHIRNKFSKFLIDESQDTSPFQYELFLYLCSQSKPVNDKYDLIPGSLFIVGDPKQSIYRFRNADIDSYNKVKQLFEDTQYPDNKVVLLTSNFRSTAILCDYFNRKFKPLMPNDYMDIDNITNKKKDGEGLFTYTDLVGVIKTLINSKDYMILKKHWDEQKQKEVEQLEPLTFEDIMVVTKAKKDTLSEIAKKLDAEGIPYFTEGDNVLDNYEIVEAIYASYCYVTYHDEPRYFYNLVTSPLFGLKKEEALALDPANPKLNQDDVEILNSLNALVGITNPVIVLKAIIDGVVFKYVSSQRMDYAYFILNKMEDAYSNNNVTTLDDGATYLFELIQEAQERIAQMKNKPNAVYVANIHKVKGLERPVVIICKSGTNNNIKAGITKHMDYNSNQSYIFRLAKKDYGFNSFEISNSLTFPDQLELETKKLKEEFLRLEYVAVTRARNYLLIEKDFGDNVTKNCWLNLIDDSFQEFVVDATAKINKPAPASKPNNNLDAQSLFSSNKNETYQIVLPSKLALNHEGSSETETITNQTDNTAAEKGTLVHALMEIYATSNFAYSNSDVVEETLSRYGQSSNDQYRQMLTDVINTMTSGGYPQSSGQKEDLISILKTASEIYCEVPFSYQEGNNIYNGSIDLLYKLGDKYYIVDYKTNYDGTDLDNKYEKQLEAYQKAIKDIEGIAATARIYHIDIK